MQIGALGQNGALLAQPSPPSPSRNDMRTLLNVIAFLAAAAVVDSLWLDGRYRHAMWLEANYQGQQFRYEVDSIVRKVVGR